MFQTYVYNILSMDKPHEFESITYERKTNKLY